MRTALELYIAASGVICALPFWHAAVHRLRHGTWPGERPPGERPAARADNVVPFPRPCTDDKKTAPARAGARG